MHTMLEGGTSREEANNRETATGAPLYGRELHRSRGGGGVLQHPPPHSDETASPSSRGVGGGNDDGGGGRGGAHRSRLAIAIAIAIERVVIGVHVGGVIAWYPPSRFISSSRW